MGIISLFNKDARVESVLDWIDNNRECAHLLDCTHFEFNSINDGYFIVSMWAQGLNCPQEQESLEGATFEDVGNGWSRRHLDFNHWHYFKDGALYLITECIFS